MFIFILKFTLWDCYNKVGITEQSTDRHVLGWSVGSSSVKQMRSIDREVMMSTRRCSKVLVVMWMCAVALSAAAPTLAEIVTFQQGVNGYDRAQDTEIRWAFETNFGDTPEYDSPHSGDSSSYEMYSTNGGRRSILEVGHFFQRAIGFISGGGQLPQEAGPTYRYSRFFIRFREVLEPVQGRFLRTWISRRLR